MKTRLMAATAAAGTLGVVLAASGAAASPAERADLADHGHILVLDVTVIPGTFPPRPSAVRACIDLAGGRPVPVSAHHDQLHVDFDGGDFTARTGHVVIPTHPYAAPGAPPVPWNDCEDFMAFFGLD